MVKGKSPGFLMRGLYEERQKQLARDRATSARSNSVRQDDEIMQMTETKIYIGLNDAQTKEQKFETKKYMSVLKHICRSYHTAFSVDIEDGGYFHDDGEYTEETSFVLLLINADRDVVRQIANDLCVFFHQESVLVTENLISGYSVKGMSMEQLP